VGVEVTGIDDLQGPAGRPGDLHGGQAGVAVRGHVLRKGGSRSLVAPGVLLLHRLAHHREWGLLTFSDGLPFLAVPVPGPFVPASARAFTARMGPGSAAWHG